ncbi:MAG TPA: hypothetical protein VHN20_16275 [Beijerinckiaceae bacterium]|nr:hypothetical protein [Beijerinckiaceae bacterium]
MTMDVPHEPDWRAKARAISDYADLFWRSSRDNLDYLKGLDLSAASPRLTWVEKHWPPRNTFEQSVFLSIAAMLARGAFTMPIPSPRRMNDSRSFCTSTSMR